MSVFDKSLLLLQYRENVNGQQIVSGPQQITYKQATQLAAVIHTHYTRRKVWADHDGAFGSSYGLDGSGNPTGRSLAGTAGSNPARVMDVRVGYQKDKGQTRKKKTKKQVRKKYWEINKRGTSGGWEKNPGRGNIFSTPSHPPWIPSDRYRVTFPGIKRPERGTDHPHLSSTDIKE